MLLSKVQWVWLIRKQLKLELWLTRLPQSPFRAEVHLKSNIYNLGKNWINKQIQVLEFLERKLRNDDDGSGGGDILMINYILEYLPSLDTALDPL